MFPKFRSLAVTLLVALPLPAPALAQVPDGWFVVSSFKSDVPQGPFPPFPGLGGIHFVHPRNPLPPVSVVGLPNCLTGSGSPPGPSGANAVLRRSDGVLFVGEIVPQGGMPLHLHMLTIVGSQVTSDTPINLGTSGGAGAQVSQSAFLPNGDLLVAVAQVNSGPLAGTNLGVVSPTSLMAVPVILGPVPAGVFNALAVDAQGAFAYIGIYHSVISSTIVRIPLPVPPGVIPTTVASLPKGVTGLALDYAGNLIAACNNGQFSGANLFSINVQTGAVTTLASPIDNLNGVVPETATGFLATISDSLNGVARVFWDQLELTSGPPGGWGVVSGIDLDPNPETYGQGTPGVNSYRWSFEANSVGLPLVNNPNFSLTLRSSPGAAPGIFGLSLASVSLPFSGITLLVDPHQLLIPLLMALPSGNPVTIPLPIPDAPSLRGTRLFGQTVHTEPGLAASNGIRFTIL